MTRDGTSGQQPPHQQPEELRMSASPNVWLPLTVVKRHRTKATIIWVSLFTMFLAYVVFVVWEAFQSRRDPAARFELKREPYAFPDIMVCFVETSGCLTEYTPACKDTANLAFYQEGFLEDELEPDEASLAIEEAFSNCKVMPLSKLTVNQTGIDNGDIQSFYAVIYVVWQDDPYGDYDVVEEYENSGFALDWQFIGVYFLDVDKGVEAAREKNSDVQLPYNRVSSPTTDGMYALTVSHMILSLTEFRAISAASGKKQEVEQTYTQATTSATYNWYDPEFYEPYAELWFEMRIPKFEFTSIEEVDPVDAWAMIGAIGGVWQFVAIAFGLCLVFSEKQLPDKKIRNFRKTLTKPAVVVNRRFSSSRASTEDIEIDASDEDLPVEWVKKQRKNGTTYYFHTLTGAALENSPLSANVHATGAPVAPSGRSSIARVFNPAYNIGIPAGSAHGPNGGSIPNHDSLPPGWIERTDANGRLYYVDTIMKTTQWDRPHQQAMFTGGPGVQVIDAPMRRGSNSYSEPNYSNSSRGRIDRAAVQFSINSGGGVEITASREPQPTFGGVPAAPSRPSRRPSRPAPHGAGRITSSTGETHGSVGGGRDYAHAETQVTQWKAPRVKPQR